MPPQIYITAEQVPYDQPSGTFTVSIPTPSKLRKGDRLIVAFALESNTVALDNVDGEDLADSGWAELSNGTVSTRKLILYGREITGAEPASSAFVLSATAVLGAGVVIVYRESSGVPAEATISAVAASTNFVMPSRTLGAYSDMFLGITWARLGSVMTPPAGCTERIEITATDGTLAVYELLPEVAGATGTKTAVGGTARNGFAASFAIPATGLRAVGKVFAIDPPGAIGLPTEGV